MEGNGEDVLSESFLQNEEQTDRAINMSKELPGKEEKAEETSSGNSFMEELFGSSFGFGDDFFEAPEPKKKENGKTSSKEKASKAEKKDEKGNKDSKSDLDVALPVVVKARNFAVTLDGEGSKKLSAIWDELVVQGYRQLEIDGCFNLTYVESLQTVFVCEKTNSATDNDTAVELSGNKKVTVCDGMLQAEFSLDNFIGKEADEVSLLDVAFAFAQINPAYEGCRLAYDGEKQICYPVLGKMEEKDFENTGLQAIIKEGNSEVLSMESYKDIVGCYGQMGSKTTKVDVVLQKGGNNTGFISFVGYSGFSKTADSKSKKAKKKVEEKFKLPLTVTISNWGEIFSLSESDFEGKQKVTLEEIKKNLGNKHKIFKDTSRKMDYYYDENAARLSIMFISGSKGCELIRSEEEFLEAKKKTSFFDGIYPDKNIRLRVLPAGNFITFNGSGRNLYVPERMEWERRIPKMPISLLKEIVAYFKEDLSKEAMVHIYYDTQTGNFRFRKAKGERSKVHINYEFVADMDLMTGKSILVMDIHSHNTMPAFFSPADDKDESYRPGLFGVIGNLHSTPHMLFRAGVDGKFTQYPVGEFFEAHC